MELRLKGSFLFSGKGVFSMIEAELNKLICGDNLEVMKALYSRHGSFIDLIYIDPPFYSNSNYGVKGSGLEFNDKYINISEYITYLIERIKWMHKLLKDTGSIFVHLDWHAAHYIKVEMDKVFGVENFLNEIIWSYEGIARPKRYLPRKHDNILSYSKTKGNIFNPVHEPYSENSSKRYNLFDEDGRKYRITTKKRKVLMKPEGKSCTSVWQIPFSSTNKDRVGYPTQKPKALLERIVTMSSNKEDIVADFFCGSGTTLVVAEELGRAFIAVDVNQNALDLASKRLPTRLFKKIV